MQHMEQSAIGVILFGLGPIGQGIARQVAERPYLRIVGAVDIDPAKEGKDVGEIIGLGRALGVAVSADPREVLAKRGGQVVMHATGSYLPNVRPQLEMILQAGLNIVSTCEELSEPWAQNRQIADHLDRIAKEHNVTALGTGINPGFIMDTLPVALSAVCRGVERVHVRRLVDASKRRQPLQAKIGSGLTPEEFMARAGRKEIRHVGLTESVSLLARGLGWTLDDIQETIEPVVAQERIKTDHFEVAPGYVCGTHQLGYGIKGDERVITLDLQMSLDAGESVDEVRIEGPSPLYARLEGVHGDTATASVAVNAIRRVVAAPPGLLTMVDLPVVCYTGYTNSAS